MCVLMCICAHVCVGYQLVSEPKSLTSDSAFSCICCLAPLHPFSSLQSRVLHFHSVTTGIDLRKVGVLAREGAGECPPPPPHAGCSCRFPISCTLALDPGYTVSVRGQAGAGVSFEDSIQGFNGKGSVEVCAGHVCLSFFCVSI